ncbi:MAG: dockerin type I domain-containing protein, partial [Usitatibacteraceae bacterium]
AVPGLAQSGGSLIELKEIVRSPTGRLFIRGPGELLSSDDNGTTWQFRYGTFFTNGLRGGEFWGATYDLRFINGHWMMPMELANFSEPVRDNKFNWMLISDDDGNTWYRKEIPSSFAKVRGLIAGASQRAIVFGTRGAVWLSDGTNITTPPSPRFYARAGDVAHIQVSRPPVAGVVQMRYSAVQDRTAVAGSVATAGTDYTPTAGILQWLAGDDAAKFVDVQTINTQVSAANKQFLLQLIPENIDLGAAATIPVTILNISQSMPGGLEILDGDSLVLSPGGPAKAFRAALRRAPAADVTVTLTANGATAGTFAPSTLTFNATNWQIPQTVTVTPAASVPVPGSSYRIRLVLSTTDPAYANVPTYSVSYRYPTNFVPGPFSLLSVQSRKTHGVAGPFDLAIDTAQPITGSVSVESRVIGAGHTIVFQFDAPITATGTVATTAGSATAAIVGNDVEVTLTGIPDNSRATVSLTNVNNAGVDASASIGFLIGDINGTRSANSSDISGVKARSGQSTNAANFKFDVNANGAVNSSDISAVKARSGLVIP